MRIASKHLGKSRLPSSTVVEVGSPTNRSDVTLLQQHDGIQSAILHCKRSFNLRHGSEKIGEGKVKWGYRLFWS
ncbi:hypothetical protein RJT34_25366 [Clitoria ternatea]|uniref:Uncharacterized protein n=1 Tax=Clitoria ternatea TaxID=43366 RepID=A0AAN9FPR6_CLITE